jgi:hypothetical protein
MSNQGAGAPGVVGSGAADGGGGAGLGVYGIAGCACDPMGEGVAPPVVVEPNILQVLACLGFIEDYAQKIEDAHLIATTENLSELSDDDVVKLCGVLCKPGSVDEDGSPNTGCEVIIKGQMQIQNAAAFCRVCIMCRDPGFCSNFIISGSTAPYKQLQQQQ